MWKMFIGYYRPYIGLFALDMSCAFAVAICDLFYPLIAKNIINIYVPDQNMRLLITWSLILLVIYLGKMGLNYIIAYYGHILGVHIQADMRRDLFRHLEKLPFSYFDETKSGTLMSRLVNDLFEVSELAHHAPEDLFISVLMFFGSFAMLASINLPLTLIIFASIPFIVVFAAKMRHMMGDAFKKSREQIAEVNANIETAISGVRVSRAYTTEEHENAKFEAENNAFRKIRAYAYKAMGIFNCGMTFFTDLLYLIVLIAGGLFFYYGKIDIGEFAAYLLYINMFLNPIRRMVALFEQLQEGMTGLKRYKEIMDTPAEEDSPDAKELTHPDGDICFENVTFGYGEEGENHSVIKNLDLSISAGKTLALVGPSGGGKTTLCNLIPRFYEIESGRITVSGVDIKDVTRLSLRKNIGIVSQDVFLFNGTIRENIAYGNLDATDEQIAEAAKKASIHDYIMTLDNGYATEVGERGVKLSGGQKQRISIARVFLKDPSILILDEATSALDNATEMQIQSALEKLMRGRTVVVVAHRLSTVRNADEIVVIDKDGIVEKGTHDELVLHNHGLYKSLYDYQLR